MSMVHATLNQNFNMDTIDTKSQSSARSIEAEEAGVNETYNPDFYFKQQMSQAQ